MNEEADKEAIVLHLPASSQADRPTAHLMVHHVLTCHYIMSLETVRKFFIMQSPLINDPYKG